MPVRPDGSAAHRAADLDQQAVGVVEEGDQLAPGLADGGDGECGAGRDGAFTALHDRLESYTQAGGLLPEAQRRHDDQVERVSDRITTLEDRLAIRRTVLKREFIAADLATTTLNQSAQSLSALTGQYQLF